MKPYMKTILNAVMAWVTSKFGTKEELGTKADKAELETKADKISDSEIIEMMVEEGIVDPVSNGDNVAYADNNGKIYVL